jgi:hypothetical protein
MPAEKTEETTADEIAEKPAEEPAEKTRETKRTKWLRAPVQFLALLTAFHQAFLDFSPSMVSTNPALFRVIQWSFVFMILWFVLISLHPEVSAAEAARRRGDEDNGDIAVGVMLILTFMIASFVGWLNYSEVSQLACFRMAFEWLPKTACLIFIIKLAEEVVTRTVKT